MRIGGRIPPLALTVLILGGITLAACSSSYEFERRETPVHVWLTAPGLVAAGGSLQADITVGPYRVIRDVVRFPKGVPTVDLPTIYIRDGAYTAVARLQGGRAGGQAVVEIERESWIQIVVRGASASITVHDEQPDAWGEE